VQTDLGGLATGGGIGVLAAVEGVMPGNVDLIAPQGFVDAGDAGIRATGNLNIAAVTVLNAANIQVAGSASGVPSTPTVAAPNIAGLSAASNATGAGAGAAAEAAKQATSQAKDEEEEELPSTITVEVLGYGGGEG
jgi:filamentous hemagglutinin